MKFIFYYIILRWFFNVILMAQQNPIETLFVRIEADTSDLLGQIDEGVNKSEGELNKLGAAGRKSGQEIKKSSAIAGAAFGAAASAAAALLGVVLQLAVAIPRMFNQLVQRSVELNREFEQVRITFSNIFGSSDQAEAFLRQLRSQAADLGIAFSDASQFAKSILPDTKNIAQFNELLRLAAVGAKDANLPLRDLIFSFNEAVAGDFVSIRDRLDIPRDVIARIKESDDTVGALTEELDALFTKRGVNDIEAFGGTFDSIRGKINSFFEDLIFLGGQPLFEELKKNAVAFLQTLQDNQPILTEIAVGIGQIAGEVVRFVREDLFGGIDGSVGPALKKVKEFVGVFGRATKAGGAAISIYKRLAKSIIPVLNAFNALQARVTGVSQITDLLKRVFTDLDKALITGAQILAFVTAGWEFWLAALAPVADVLSAIGSAISAFFSGDFVEAANQSQRAMSIIQDGLFDLEAGSEAWKKSFLESARDINRALEDVETPEGPTDDNFDFDFDTDEIEEGGERAKEILSDLATEFIDLQEQTNQQLEALASGHAERLATIEEQGAERRKDINEDAAEALLDLERDVEKQRADIVADAQNELADLASDTDQKLSDQREDAQRDEMRQTADHLRSMRRQEQDHVDQLSDAVRSRDAVRIVDLQRNFARESGRREEDFNVGQGRDREDQNQELTEIREFEARRRQEILDNRAQELAELVVMEQERRTEIEARRMEQLADLDQNLAQQRAKEAESFSERQADLEGALQRKLEAIAKNLADEKDMTEEGAEGVLSALNEYFGIGGNIDELMETFRARQRTRMEIEVGFKAPSRSSVNDVLGNSPVGLPPALPGLGSSIPAFADGGQMIARKPTLALFGEKQPEFVNFTPLAQMGDGDRLLRIKLEVSGNAPPGIGSGERDAIAGVLLRAIQESGSMGGDS